MKLPHRRQFLHLAACAAALPTALRFAWAQAYPSRPVRVIVPFAPAGTTDIAARLMGQWLSERLGQQFVIENRPGASTTIGTEVVVRAPADGYTQALFDWRSANRVRRSVARYTKAADKARLACDAMARMVSGTKDESKVSGTGYP